MKKALVLSTLLLASIAFTPPALACIGWVVVDSSYLSGSIYDYFPVPLTVRQKEVTTPKGCAETIRRFVTSNNPAIQSDASVPVFSPNTQKTVLYPKQMMVPYFPEDYSFLQMNDQAIAKQGELVPVFATVKYLVLHFREREYIARFDRNKITMFVDAGQLPEPRMDPEPFGVISDY